MDNGLEKRYGLLTAIAMVVGIVIGSGVFFKAGKGADGNWRQPFLRNFGVAFGRFGDDSVARIILR